MTTDTILAVVPWLNEYVYNLNIAVKNLEEGTNHLCLFLGTDLKIFDCKFSLGGIIFGAVALGFFLSLIFAFILNNATTKKLNAKIDKLSKKFATKDELTNKLSSVQSDFSHQRQERIAAPQGPTREEIEAEARRREEERRREEQRQQEEARRQELARRRAWQEKIIDDFNNLPKAPSEIKNFCLEYRVSGIVCENSKARMVNSSLPPVFANSQLDKGSLWAAELDWEAGTYFVLPRKNISYEVTIHNAGGMKEAFDSNYTSGTYNKITVEKAAVFTNSGGKWVCREKGKLRLG